MAPATRIVARRILAGVLFLVLVLAAGLAALSTVLSSGSSSSSPSPRLSDNSVRPSSVVPVPSISAPSRPQATTVVASAPPGGNSLASAGSGPSTKSFTAATSRWTLKVTFDCPASNSSFRLVASDRAGTAVATVLRTGVGDDSRTIAGPGVFAITMEGACSWSIAATG